MGWKGWPNGKKFALVLSHDVDTQKGHDDIPKLMDLEEKMGFRSSINIVPKRYRVSRKLLEEIKARGGPVIAVVGQGDQEAKALADDVIEVPMVEDFLQPIVSIVPLQLLSYHIALLRGCDVDKPRNLAKSVTVE